MGIRKLSDQKLTGTTGGASALDDLTDVNAPAPDDGDVLAWDSTPGEWVPVAPGTPGAHASSHQDGGGDEISVAGLAGVLADAQKVAIHRNGTLVGTRKNVNLIEGSNVTLTVVDDSGDDEVDVTIASSGSGGGDTVTVANRVFPAYDDAAIGLWPVAPLVFNKRRRWELSNTAMFGGGALTGAGASIVATNPTPNYGIPGLTPHTALTTSSTIDTAASVRNTNPEWDMGDVGPGWFFHVRFTAVAGATNFKTDSRVFIGMKATSTAMAGGTDPSTLTDLCGLAKDSADGYFYFIHNDDSGTATKVVTSLTNAPTADNPYDFFMYCPPGGGAIGWKLVDPVTDTVLGSGNVTSDLPRDPGTVGNLYTPHMFIGNGSGTTATRLDMMFMQIEAPY